MTSSLIQTVLNDPNVIDAYHDDEKFTLGVDLAKENIEVPLRNGVVFKPKTNQSVALECFGNKISHVANTLFLDETSVTNLPIIMGVMHQNGFVYARVTSGYFSTSSPDHIFWTQITFLETLDALIADPSDRLDIWPVTKAVLPKWHVHIKKLFCYQTTRTSLMKCVIGEAIDEDMTLGDLAAFLFRNEWISFPDEKYPKAFYNDDNGFRHEVDISEGEIRLYRRNPWPEVTGLHALLDA